MNKTEKVSIRITEELKKQLEAHCGKEMIPVAQYIRNLIIRDLEKKK